MSAGNTGVPCGQSAYGMYDTPLIQFQGDAGINQVSASGGYATSYVGSTGKTPVVGQQISISGVLVDDSADLNNTYTIDSIGASTGGGWVPVTVQLPLNSNVSVTLTTLTQLGLFDSHVQFPTTISLTNNIVTVNAPNNFAPNQRVAIRDALNSVFDGAHFVYTSTPTSFTYQFNHSNIAAETETNGATASGTDFVIEYVTVEGQATGNLSCVTSNFQNQGTVNTTNQKGPQYTPGNVATYTAQVDLPDPCDGYDPLDPCGGDMGGGVACADAGTCGGSNNYVGNDCPVGQLCVPVFQDEIAYTRYCITSYTPISKWTQNFLLFTITWGLFPDAADCSPETTPPDLFFPATPWSYEWDGIKVPLQPPATFFHVGYCHRFATAGPWTCVPFTQVGYPVNNGGEQTAKCTKHP